LTGLSFVAPGATIGGGANQANYKNAIGHATGAGSFGGSGSIYGTFDQSGNV
jgi:hypothetical protein